MKCCFFPVGQGEVAQPWLVDRLFRHLLTDLTGNTHHASFVSTNCTPQIRPPDGLFWVLLIWNTAPCPYEPGSNVIVENIGGGVLGAAFKLNPLWTGACFLQDRFMLSHFLWLGILRMCWGLSGNKGIRCKILVWTHSWSFAARHRSPGCGGCEVEIRHALEPWHVLAKRQPVQERHDT